MLWISWHRINYFDILMSLKITVDQIQNSVRLNWKLFRKQGTIVNGSIVTQYHKPVSSFSTDSGVSCWSGLSACFCLSGVNSSGCLETRADPLPSGEWEWLTTRLRGLEVWKQSEENWLQTNFTDKPVSKWTLLNTGSHGKGDICCETLLLITP